MAINKLPSQKQDVWIQIGTSTPTSGSTVSFTSIASDWRKLRLVNRNVDILLTGAEYCYVRCNSLTGATDYRWFAAGSRGTNAVFSFVDEPGIYTYTGATNSRHNFDLYLTNPNYQFPIVTFDGVVGTNQESSNIASGFINGITTSISTLSIVTGSTFSASNTGTITLYGTY